MLYDCKNNSGWLVFGMKNLRKKFKKNEALPHVNNTVDTSSQSPYTEIRAKEDVDFLKSTKADSDHMEIIKEKLKLTSSYRKKMLADVSIDLLEWFPYFFTCPELVSVAKKLFCYVRLNDLLNA